MKKVKSLLSVLLCISIAIVFTGCTNKTAITADSFITSMTNLGYSVGDAAEQYSEYEHITSAHIAIDSTESYQIEFYEAINDEFANAMYSTNKQDFETENKDSSVRTSVEIGNHCKYTNVHDGKYIIISRIANTIMFAVVDAQYKTAVDEVFKALGY